MLAAVRRTVTSATRSTASGTDTLSTAELRVLSYLSTHLTTKEIGERLYVSINTVKKQATSVYRKLGVSSRSEAKADPPTSSLPKQDEKEPSVTPHGPTQ